jgi:25S rRNA (uracil2634-N3)-methyltransferase
LTFRAHKRLLRDFFCNALYLLIPYGEIHVRHKTEGPYDRWDLEELASDSSLIIFEKEKFQKADYPGYNQKRGDGARCDHPFPLGLSCTFKFQIGDLKKRKKSSGNNATSTSFICGSNVRPSGKLETDTRLLYLLPPVQARPWLHFTPPANTIHMPIPLQPYIAQRQQTLSLADIVRALSYPQPMFSIAGPSLNAWRAPGSISSPMGRIACPNLLAPQEQPWLQQRSIAGQPGGDVCSYFEHQRCLQRDYEERRKAMMPGAAGLIYSSAFLDQCHRESVQRQWLRDYEVRRKAMMPGAAGLKYSSAFLEQCRRDVQRQEQLNKR